MFTCYQYCKEQKRGHVHRLSYKDANNLGENLKNDNIRKFGKIYECKCEFFWKIFLGFRFETEFDKESIKEFNKCRTVCGHCLKYNETNFCNLDLWHREKTHDFSCRHNKLIPYHTIFIIDKSGSMGSPDINPSNNKLCKNEDFNNRLGCVIEVINNYIKKRLEINKLDLFSLVSFSTDAMINMRDIGKDGLDNFDFIDECMLLMGYPKGDTFFNKGFKEAENILLEIDYKKYNPLIILLSDGDDDDPKVTINSVREVSYHF